MARVRRLHATLATATLLGAFAFLGSGCGPSAENAPSPREGTADGPSPSDPAPEGTAEASSVPPSPSPTGSASASPSASTTSPSPSEQAEPRRSYMTIPKLGMRDFPVVRYRGSPDDAPGTRIQNADEMASPRGPRGGVGPGQVGNYIVTGHRLTGAAPLRDAPSLRRGDTIVVRSGDVEHTYEVVTSRETSFRSAASLEAQRAPVPGRPGQEPTQAMLTLSTCATPEDHAVGNYWSDEFGNPEHRIDKIAVLRSSRPVG